MHFSRSNSDSLFLPPATKLGQGYVFTHVCDSIHRGMVSQHALQAVSKHALQQVSKGGWYPSMPCSFPGPHPGGKLRGLTGGVSRPTPKGEVEGSGLWGSSGPHLGGVSRPTPKGSIGPHPRGLQAHTWGVYHNMH